MIPISIVIIGKNEEKRLGRCLEAIRRHCPKEKDLVDLLFVDTGSTDQTIAIAEKYTDHIAHFTWCDDFSAARNYAMSQAYYDFVLFLDSDEYIEEVDWKGMNRELVKYPTALGRLRRRNLCYSFDDTSTTILVDDVERLYDRRRYHYEGYVHEQITDNDHSLLYGYSIPLVVFHDGYMGTKEERKAKADRNDVLLFKELEKDPHDSYVLFQLGQSAGLRNDTENAYSYYVQSYAQHPSHDWNYVPLLVVSLLQCMLELNKFEEAIQLLAEEYDFQKENADFLSAAGHLYIACGMLVEAIDMFQEALQAKEYSIEGKNSFMAHHNLGCIYEALDNEVDALAEYEAAGDFPPSKERLHNLKERLKEQDTRNWKKVSLIIPVTDSGDYSTGAVLTENLSIENPSAGNVSAENLSTLFTSLTRQTIGISHLEIILVNLSRNLQIKKALHEFETIYPDSVIIIEGNISKANVTKYEACDIGFSYATSDYVIFHQTDESLHPDALRYLRATMIQSDSDFAAEQVNFQEEESFCIQNITDSVRQQIITSNMLGHPLWNKMFSMLFLKHYQLRPTEIAVSQAAIQKASCIACLSRRLLS
ncbi:MAG: glycosyltransferase [Lachnospiraceae bacterium]